MAWYDEAVFYHIYPLGLTGAPKENPYGEPEHRLNTLLPWISHIKEIGCNALYIGPLFESVGHGYETTDYKKLDSRLGTNEDLTGFVAECHKQGIKVILDGVFNHTGRDFFAFQDIRKNRENSAYKDWYCNVNFWGNNSFNDGFSYENWGGYDLLVKLNQHNPAVKDYICDVIRFWVSEFDIDGIRLDAADVLDFNYMQALRHTANEVKPDFWLMGEVIHGDYTRWVNEGTLHSVTNYNLHKALYSGHNEHNYFEIAHTVKRLYGMGGNRPDGLKLYNFVDNHDVERIYTRLNNKAHFTPVHILLYTLPGVPSIYYGSEFGIEGKKERFSDASLRPALNLADYADAVKNNSFTRLSVRQEKTDDTHVMTFYRCKDTGIGMSREYLGRIFDTFSQEQNRNISGITGTGLGMPISKLLANAMGGDITVESELHAGSTFTVSIPSVIVKEIPDYLKETEKNGTAKESLHSRKHSGPGKILVAEDVELNAEILLEILSMEGFETAHAQNGREAVELFRESEIGEFGIILMDMQMPVMDGCEASREIRKLNRADAQSVQIYACTANTFQEDRDLALASGMNDFLTKPIDIDVLLKKMGKSGGK